MRTLPTTYLLPVCLCLCFCIFVVYAQSGQVALKIARRAKPNLILLDIIMPAINGFGICRQLVERGQVG